MEDPYPGDNGVEAHSSLIDAGVCSTSLDYPPLEMGHDKDLIPSEMDEDIEEDEIIIPASDIRVLLVDDDRILLIVVERMLQKCFFKVTTCSKAVEALALLRQKRDEFDVVITDVEMPEMDGFKLLEHIRQEMDDLPVIMTSADGKRDTVRKAWQYGAKDYLLKPIQIERLKMIPKWVVPKKKN